MIRRFPSLCLFAVATVAASGCIFVAAEDDDMMDSLDAQTGGGIDDDGETLAPGGTRPADTDSITAGDDSDDGSTTADDGSTTADDGLVCSANLILDPSFEGGSPSDAWKEDSALFGSPLCDGACSDDATAVPADGEWWAWFGGMEEEETASVAQPIAFSGDAATLSFALAINASAGTSNDVFAVRIDDETIFMVTDGDQAAYPDYTTVEVDVSAYADGQEHMLSFEAELAGGGLTNFFLDEVSLVECDDATGSSSSGSTGADDSGSGSSGGSSSGSSSGDSTAGDESGSSGSTSGE